jgi:hypothetical protein
VKVQVRIQMWHPNGGNQVMHVPLVFAILIGSVGGGRRARRHVTRDANCPR